jgi:hypothetical protein
LKAITTGLPVILVLTLAACVAPQHQPTPVEPPVAVTAAPTMSTQPVTRAPAVPAPAVKTAAQAAPVAPSNAPKTDSLAKYQELLEAQLLCPSKSLVMPATMQNLSNAQGIFSKQGKKLPSGGVVFPLAVDFSVFGFKVLGLELMGGDGAEGSAIFANIKATPAEAAQLFKSRHIALKSKKGEPGAWGIRPAKSDVGQIFDHVQLTGYKKSPNGVTIGCYIDFAD